MSKKRVFVFGATGMLGAYVTKYLSLQPNIFVVPVTREDFDILKANYGDLINWCRHNEVEYDDVIVNCAGLIKHRNSSHEDMMKVNTWFPYDLQEISIAYGCPVIHITTDCVYSGKAGKPYNENSPHDAEDDYGKTKSGGEPLLITNIRTSIIGEEKNNKLSLIEWVKAQQDKDVDLYCAVYWNGVTCLQLAKYIYEIINKDKYWLGTRHYHSPNKISKSSLIQDIAHLWGITFKSTTQIDALQQHKMMTLKSNYSFKKPPPILVQLQQLKEFNICQNE